MEIVLDSLSKTFDTQRAVADVSFRAGIGVTGFLGPNGAGKSTTMRMITGYLEPTSGEVLIDGRSAWPSHPDTRRMIGYLPEHNPLYPELYVREYLRYTAKLQGVANATSRVDEIIQQVGLTQEVGKQIGQLSKGYRQRVGLAQALVHDPPVLVLDEPTSGFDPNQLADIRTLVRQLGQTKVVLFSTHIMQEVQALCQRVLIINRGELVVDETIDNLQHRMQGQTLIHLLLQQSAKPDVLASMPGVKSVKVNGHRVALTVAADTELRPQLAKLVADNGWGLLEMRTESSSVEDVFQAITRQNPQA